MRLLEAALQYFVDLDAEIFRSRHGSGEFLQCIQILQVVAGEQFPFDESIKIDEVADHSGRGIDLAADCDFQGVIVSVSVRVVAFAVGREIFFRGHGFAVQPMGGGEQIAAGEVGDENSSRFSVLSSQCFATGRRTIQMGHFASP